MRTEEGHPRTVVLYPVLITSDGLFAQEQVGETFYSGSETSASNGPPTLVLFPNTVNELCITGWWVAGDVYRRTWRVNRNRRFNLFLARK